MKLQLLRKKQQKIKPLTLEYFIVFQKSGLPIFSKCFGDFCAILLVDDLVLTGFLSALTSMPAMFGTNTELDAIEIGYSKLHFNYTTPSGHTICLGFKNEKGLSKRSDLIDDLFKKITDFVEVKHKDKEWAILKAAEIRAIEYELINTVITPCCVIDPIYKDHGGKCSMSIESDLFREENDVGITEPIWKRFADVFAQRRVVLKDSLDQRREKLLKRGLLKPKNDTK